MATLDDIRGKVTLNDGETHKVLLDPKSQLVERQGQSGPYWVMSVQEDGDSRDMSIGNPLARAIQDLKLKETTELLIQRMGTGFQTSYNVSKA